MRGELIFVYGTLRRAIKGDMARLLSRQADYVAQGTYQGQLFRVAAYPGVVPSDDPEEVVTGDVYALRSPKRVLPELDQYEGLKAAHGYMVLYRYTCYFVHWI